MKSNRRTTLFVALAAIGLTASSLGAADVVGSFTLPAETHWGTVILPAGDYTFTLDHAVLNGHILVTRGTDQAAFILPRGMDFTSHSGGSSMLIVGNSVRSVHLAPVGLTYNYQVHRVRGEKLAGRSGATGVSLSIVAK